MDALSDKWIELAGIAVGILGLVWAWLSGVITWARRTIGMWLAREDIKALREDIAKLTEEVRQLKQLPMDKMEHAFCKGCGFLGELIGEREESATKERPARKVLTFKCVKGCPRKPWDRWFAL